MEEKDCKGERDGGSHNSHGEEITVAHLGGLREGGRRRAGWMRFAAATTVAVAGGVTLLFASHAAHVLLAMGHVILFAPATLRSATLGSNEHSRFSDTSFYASPSPSFLPQWL